MKPSLDYYIGRPVEAVETGEEGAWDWAILFPGDVRVHNTDQDKTEIPEDVEGKIFLSTAMGELDTRMMFGHYEDGEPVIDTTVELSPLEYTISDERFEGGPHYPQRLEEEEEALPEDPSPDRVAEGPSDEWVPESEMALDEPESDGEGTE